MTPTAIAAYLVLFATVGFVFVLASLVLGKLLRSREPTPPKVETYECGEPAVGPGSVQFDLRFYVVALLFLIFEVEVAFFFPPATVFGKANRLRDPHVTRAVVQQTCAELGVADDREDSVGWVERSEPHQLRSNRWGSPTNAARRCPSTHPTGDGTRSVPATTLAISSMLDLGVFFAVLLVGFAFVWRRGDLDWVRAVAHPSAAIEEQLIGDRSRRLQS